MDSFAFSGRFSALSKLIKLFMKNYTLSDKVYIDADNRQDFGYSDGDETENYILQTMVNASDLSTGSEELTSAIKDWPSLYHLSSKRANLLRPFADMLKGKSILEIGCGCGAITRYLGELGNVVTALDGSLKRCTIAAERCRNLPDVKVFCDNFQHFDSPERFDVVTLIGVLEYSTVYIKDPHPVKSMLEGVKKFLRPGGIVLIAIENKLGLKYWAGAPEDHTGQAYLGLENRYTPSTAVTFGKKEIQEILQQVGFTQHTLFYPFPDYKLPDTLVTEPGMQEETFDVPMLLLEEFEYVQSEYYTNHFSTSLVSPELKKNGLLADLANSFMVVAAFDGATDILPADLLAVKYNIQRKRPYQKVNVFRLNNDKKIEVSTNRLYPDLAPADSAVSNKPPSDHYLKGELLLFRALKIISRKNWELSELSRWANRYFDVLSEYAFEKEGQLWLDGKYLDLTPFNIIINKEDGAGIFDQEWISDAAIPLGYIFFRGIYHSLGKVSFFNIPAEGVPLDILDLTVFLYKDFLPYHDHLIEAYRSMETTNFSGVAPGNYIPFDKAPLKLRKEDFASQQEEIERLKENLRWYQETYEQRSLLGVIRSKMALKFTRKQ